MAVYPTGTKVFTTKHNLTDTVYAADVNDLQDEVSAIETQLGPVPSRAPSIPSSDTKSKDYGTVANRLNAIQMGTDIPVSHLYCESIKVKNDHTVFVPFSKVDDPFGMFNGQDITIPVGGWWLFTADAYWDLNTNGYRMMFFISGNGTELTADQRPPKTWNERATRNFLVWQGPMSKGNRIRVQMHQDSDTSLYARGIDLHVSMLRRWP